MKFTCGALVAFIMTFTSAFAYAGKAPLCPADTQLNRYMYRGVPENAPANKIYKFTQLRADIIASIGDPDRAACLDLSYKQALDEEAKYWADQVAAANCQTDADGNTVGTCNVPEEARASNEFVQNLETDTNADIKKARELSAQIQELRDQQAAAEAGGAGDPDRGGPPACANRPAPANKQFGDAHTLMCCGSKDNNDGVVRTSDDTISYEECLGKIAPSKHNFGQGLGQCAGNLVTGAFNAIIGAIKSLWHLPGMIGQILSLIRHPSTILTLADKIKQFIEDKYHAVFTCYNGYEQVQEGCKMLGSVLVALVAPEAAGALIGVLMKPLGVAGRAIELALESSSAGRKVLGASRKAAGATARAVGGTARVAGKVAKKITPKFIRRPIAGIANKIKALEAQRAALVRRIGARLGGTREAKWIGTKLSARSEAIAARVSKNGVYRSLKLKYLRADRASRLRAGGEAARLADLPSTRRAGLPSTNTAAVDALSPSTRVATGNAADRVIVTRPSNVATVAGASTTTDASALTISGRGSVTPPKMPSEPFVNGPRAEGPSGSYTTTGRPAVAPQAQNLRAAPSRVTFDTPPPVTPELRASASRMDQLSSDIRANANTREGAQGVFGTTSSKGTKVRADRFHTEVDRLEESGVITPAKAREYHDEIALAEAEARGRGKVREWKSTVQPRPAPSAPAPAPIPARGPVASRDLTNVVSRANPVTTEFVKDAPTYGYRITSSRFEDLPAAIRDHLGAVDRTTYTEEYLRENIGSVISMQMKDGKPDFYVIGKSTFDTKYRTVPVGQVAAKNGKYASGVEPFVTDPAVNPNVVGVLKTTPTKMVKMSDAGYPIDREVTIESPWGQQTKPAGSDAYLVYDEAKKQYYMVNADSAGLPASYVRSSVTAPSLEARVVAAGTGDRAASAASGAGKVEGTVVANGTRVEAGAAVTDAAATTDGAVAATVGDTATDAGSTATATTRTRTDRQLTDSRTNVEKFEGNFKRIGSKNRNRDALRAFRSRGSAKIRTEADGLHSQVDDLLAAGRITETQAASYHSNISLGERYATNAKSTRVWKTPTPVKPVVPEVPVVIPSTSTSLPVVPGAAGVARVEGAAAGVDGASAAATSARGAPLDPLPGVEPGAKPTTITLSSTQTTTQPSGLARAAGAGTTDGGTAAGGTARVAGDAADYAPIPDAVEPLSIEEAVTGPAAAAGGEGRVGVMASDTPKTWDSRNWERYTKRVSREAQAYFKENKENLASLVAKNDPRIEYYKSLGYKFKPGKKGRIDVEVPPIQTQMAKINGRIDELVASGAVREADVLRPAILYVKSPLSRVPFLRNWRKDYLAVDLGAEVPAGYRPVKNLTFQDRVDGMASGKYLIADESATADVGRFAQLIQNPDSMAALRAGSAKYSGLKMTKAQAMRFKYVEDMHEYLPPANAARFDRWLAQNRVNLGTSRLTVDQVREQLAQRTVPEMQQMLRELRSRPDPLNPKRQAEPFMVRMGTTIGDPLEVRASATVGWQQDNVPLLRRAMMRLPKFRKETAELLDQSATGIVMRSVDNGSLGKPKFMESKREFERRVRNDLSRALTSIHDSRELTPAAVMEQALSPKIDPRGSLYIYACWSGLWRANTTYYKSMCRD